MYITEYHHGIIMIMLIYYQSGWHGQTPLSSLCVFNKCIIKISREYIGLLWGCDSEHLQGPHSAMYGITNGLSMVFNVEYNTYSLYKVVPYDA